MQQGLKTLIPLYLPLLILSLSSLCLLVGGLVYQGIAGLLGTALNTGQTA